MQRRQRGGLGPTPKFDEYGDEELLKIRGFNAPESVMIPSLCCKEVLLSPLNSTCFHQEVDFDNAKTQERGM